MARAKPQRTPLTPDEREGNSAFRKLKNLYARIVPVFQKAAERPTESEQASTQDANTESSQTRAQS